MNSKFVFVATCTAATAPLATNVSSLFDRVNASRVGRVVVVVVVVVVVGVVEVAASSLLATSTLCTTRVALSSSTRTDDDVDDDDDDDDDDVANVDAVVVDVVGGVAPRCS